MRSFLIVLGVLLILGLGIYYFVSLKPNSTINKITNNADETENIKTIAEGLDTPWALVFLPDKFILLTERPGRVRLIKDGVLQKDPIINLTSVKEIGEGGLLGITIDPEFASNNFVYLYYTYQEDGNITQNKVVRMIYKDAQFIDEKVLVDKIPGSSNHNGGRIKFGPDGYLYITTGDAENPSQAQDVNSLAGKILRINKDGGIPSDNPFKNPVYSFGHRNSQGIVWDDKGNLWSTEHGRSLPSGYDEINLILKGQNYGWPIIQGDESKEGMQTPIINSTASKTWAPADIAYYNGKLYFGGLRGQSLYSVEVKGTTISNLKENLTSQFGRIREVILGPDNYIYITTSNYDGRGVPRSGDDKLIRINPKSI